MQSISGLRQFRVGFRESDYPLSGARAMTQSRRHLARRAAVQAIYQWDLTHGSNDEIESRFIPDGSIDHMDTEYFQNLIRNIPANIESIDSSLSVGLDRPLSEIDPVERAVLRVAAWELDFEPDVPWRVAIDEAIRLARLFGSENSYRFVNGVLDRVVQNSTDDE